MSQIYKNLFDISNVASLAGQYEKELYIGKKWVMIRRDGYSDCISLRLICASYAGWRRKCG